jgi:cell division protease FtsH
MTTPPLPSPPPLPPHPPAPHRGSSARGGRIDVRAWRWVLVIVAMLAIGILGWSLDRTSTDSGSLTYSAFLDRIDNKQVATAKIGTDGTVSGTLTSGASYESHVPLPLVGEALAARLEQAGVQIEGAGSPTAWTEWIFAFAPIVLLVGVFVWMARRAKGAGGMGGFGGVQRAGAKVIDAQRPQTSFADVAGYDGAKEELNEIIRFLREPEKFAAVGAKGPRGVLMLGPPGTGKTLFARAIAGEADVPFLSMSGSGFVELFVGVGASRVRDLFAQARKLAPAIVFIDEIDAVGQRRGPSSFGGNDEREQTLNQLLAEMDGFDAAEGVIVLAATNRPDVLDPALLRPGRFDRHVSISLPNRDDRRAILDVHCRGKPIGPDVDTDDLARATPGFSGADLANLANEAAICAVRHERTQLRRSDFDEARDRIVLGRRERSCILLPVEKRAVAAHEAGHAMVAALTPLGDPVARVTILPSGPALGATEQLPLDERHLYAQSFLEATLAVQLGGRAAELVAVGEASSGAADDLAKATDIATRMVRELGMSDALGPVGYGTTRDVLGPTGAIVHEFADATQRAIDNEVAHLLRVAQDTALMLLRGHATELEQLIELLTDEETIDGARVYELIGVPVPATAPRMRFAAQLSLPGEAPQTAAERGPRSPAAPAAGTP